MAVKKIPAREEVTCDVCRRICDGKDVRRAHSGKLVVQQDGLDYQGCAVGNATVSYDLCDFCLSNLEVVIEQRIAQIRSAQPQTPSHEV